jgi:hypothetical protein
VIAERFYSIAIAGDALWLRPADAPAATVAHTPEIGKPSGPSQDVVGTIEFERMLIGNLSSQPNNLWRNVARLW